MNDIEEVMEHPFFKDLDLDKLIKKELEPPFKPKISSELDLSNFDQKIVKLDVQESVVPEANQKLIQDKLAAFEKFGFTNQDNV